ncbi:hypothetical protein [Ruegeria sp.]|uniref:hypothetical protein n=1 Tax=Ruegeria sp. TaxID=1879320 RepID=UPI003AFFB549
MMDDPDELRPSGLTLCLCGRDPDTPELRAEFAKAVALSVRYGLVLGGCLWQVAEAYDDIHVTLIPGEARKLDALRAEVSDTLTVSEADMEPWTGRDPSPTRVH